MSDTGIMERIVAILNKAENTDNEHERKSFMQAAHAMSAKHSIDLSMARAHSEDKEKSRQNLPIQKSFEMGVKGDRGAGTYSDLLIAIGEAHEMTWWRIGNQEVELYGLSFDMEYVEKLYPILLIQMVEETTEFLNSGDWKRDGITRSDARFSFCRSFATTVKERIYSARIEARREAEKDYSDTSLALVLSDQKKEVRSLFRGVHPVNKFYKEDRKDRSAAGRARGREAGKRARISASEGVSQRGKIGK